MHIGFFWRRQKREKRQNYPHTKISTFTVLKQVPITTEISAKPADRYFTPPVQYDYGQIGILQCLNDSGTTISYHTLLRGWTSILPAPMSYKSLSASTFKSLDTLNLQQSNNSVTVTQVTKSLLQALLLGN